MLLFQRPSGILAYFNKHDSKHDSNKLLVAFWVAASLFQYPLLWIIRALCAIEIVEEDMYQIHEDTIDAHVPIQLSLLAQPQECSVDLSGPKILSGRFF